MFGGIAQFLYHVKICKQILTSVPKTYSSCHIQLAGGLTSTSSCIFQYYLKRKEAHQAKKEEQARRKAERLQVGKVQVCLNCGRKSFYRAGNVTLFPIEENVCAVRNQGTLCPFFRKPPKLMF